MSELLEAAENGSTLFPNKNSSGNISMVAKITSQPKRTMSHKKLPPIPPYHGQTTKNPTVSTPGELIREDISAPLSAVNLLGTSEFLTNLFRKKFKKMLLQYLKHFQPFLLKLLTRNILSGEFRFFFIFLLI